MYHRSTAPVYRMHFIKPRMTHVTDRCAPISTVAPTRHSIMDKDECLWTLERHGNKSAAMHPVESMLFTLLNAAYNESGVVHTVNVLGAMLALPANAVLKPFVGTIPKLALTASNAQEVVDFTDWTAAARKMPSSLDRPSKKRLSASHRRSLLREDSDQEFDEDLIHLAWNNDWDPEHNMTLEVDLRSPSSHSSRDGIIALRQLVAKLEAVHDGQPGDALSPSHQASVDEFCQRYPVLYAGPEHVSPNDGTTLRPFNHHTIQFDSGKLLRHVVAASNHQLLEHILAIPTSFAPDPALTPRTSPPRVVEVNDEESDMEAEDEIDLECYRKIAYDLVDAILSQGDVDSLHALGRQVRRGSSVGKRSFGRKLAIALSTPTDTTVPHATRSGDSPTQFVVSTNAARGLAKSRSPLLLWKEFLAIVDKRSINVDALLPAAAAALNMDLAIAVLEVATELSAFALLEAVVNAIEAGFHSLLRLLFDHEPIQSVMARVLERHSYDVLYAIVHSAPNQRTVEAALQGMYKMLGDGEAWENVIASIRDKSITSTYKTEHCLKNLRAVVECCNTLCPAYPILTKEWAATIIPTLLVKDLDPALLFLLTRVPIDPLIVLDNPICGGVPLFHLCVLYGMHHSVMFFLTEVEDVKTLLTTRVDDDSDLVRFGPKSELRDMNPNDIGHHVSQQNTSKPQHVKTASLVRDQYLPLRRW